ncbi:MAG: alpha/beta hydrolase [Proteobacteria bacterium]|nr:alpha/beta hydrolase [Pseudomonadota bacterium]
MTRRSALMAGLSTLAAACTPSLATFDALTPKDSGARRVLRDAVFGTEARQRLDLYAPEGTASNARLPVIVFMYGGSWASGDKDDYQFLGRALASRGFVVAIPNYRLVPQVMFPAFIDDCALAVKWVTENIGAHGGDAGRIVLSGHSAGAYNGVMLTLDERYLLAVGASPRIVRGFAGLAGPYDFLPFDVAATRNAFGRAGDPQATQPTHFVRADGPPLLLLWGDRDTTVGRRSITSMERAARAIGETVEARIYPRVDHVGIMLALSVPFRGNGPVLQDVTDFAHRVTS